MDREPFKAGNQCNYLGQSDPHIARVELIHEGAAGACVTTDTKHGGTIYYRSVFFGMPINAHFQRLRWVEFDRSDLTYHQMHRN